MKAIKKILMFISKFTYKKRNLWLFGSWDGKLYADNTKYLFEYINEKCPNVNAFWVSKDKSVCKKIKQKGYKYAYAKSIKGIFLILHCKVFFETSGFNDISYFIPQNVLEIQLWHGMGFKNVGKNDLQAKSNFIPPNKFYNRTTSYDLAYWMVASNEAISKYSNAFNVPSTHFCITGQPKDDEFINLPSRSLFDEILDKFDKKFNKIIFYLPTHRNFGKKDDKSVLEEETLKKVNDKLIEKNVLLLYKPHFNDRKNFEHFTCKLSNICFLLDFTKYEDIYEILPFCDAMISDYSGIIFGYLNANKPIIMFPYDLDSYSKTDMGFCYDYKEIAPGPLCYSWDAVLIEISKLVDGIDEFYDKRNAILNRFCTYHDGNNKVRVVNEVYRLLGREN